MEQVTVIDRRMSSLEIAEVTCKNHADVMRDIRKQLTDLEINHSKFASVAR
jgi:phage regulator Rha-like protein